MSQNASGKRVSADDVVVISVIGLGLIGSVVLLAGDWPMPPTVIAVLLSTAVAALVYRFLGGISSETSFQTGAIKLGGSMAALIASFLVIQKPLGNEMRTIEGLFEPKFGTNWVAVDPQTLAPTPVTVTTLKEGVLNTIAYDKVTKRPLDLEATDDGEYFEVKHEDEGDNLLGVVTNDELKRLYRKRFDVRIGGADRWSRANNLGMRKVGDKITLEGSEIELKDFDSGSEAVLFEVKKKQSGEDGTPQELRLENKQQKVVNLGGGHLMIVAVLERNPWQKDKGEMWARIFALEIFPDFEDFSKTPG